MYIKWGTVLDYLDMNFHVIPFFICCEKIMEGGPDVHFHCIA